MKRLETSSASEGVGGAECKEERSHDQRGLFYCLAGPYLRKAPVIVDKPDVVYVVENQPASVTITLNHVHAAVAWKR